MSSELADEVIDLLSPIIGEFMAETKVKAACEMIDEDMESLDHTQIEPFAEKLETAFENSLGPKAAKSIKLQVLDKKKDAR